MSLSRWGEAVARLMLAGPGGTMPACSPLPPVPSVGLQPHPVILPSDPAGAHHHVPTCHRPQGHCTTGGRKYRERDVGAGLGVKSGGYSDLTVTALAWAIESNVKPMVWFPKTCTLKEHLGCDWDSCHQNAHLPENIGEAFYNLKMGRSSACARRKEIRVILFHVVALPARTPV